MENRAHALAAGVFMLLLTAALGAAAVWLSGDTLERVSYLLVSRSAVSGLLPKAPVRLRGVEIGNVETIRFDPQDPRRILVGIAVDSGTPITQGTYARLALQGITGLTYVELDDEGTRSEPWPDPPDLPPRIPMRPSILDEMGNAGQELIGRANDALERVNALLSDQNLVQITHILASLETTSSRVGALAEKLEPALKALPKLTARAEPILKRVDPLLANLNGLTLDLRQRVGAVDRLVRDADDISGAVKALEDAVLANALPKFYSLTEKLSKTAGTLDRLLADVSERPQSLVFGKPPSAPGPGEPGFAAW